MSSALIIPPRVPGRCTPDIVETCGVLAEHLRGHSSAEFPELIGTVPFAVRTSTPNLMLARLMPMAPLLGPRPPDLSIGPFFHKGSQIVVCSSQDHVGRQGKPRSRFSNQIRGIVVQ